MTRIVHITPQNHMVGLWPGGKTRQIYIHPPGARYADKDFLFRISSVSVEQEESTFPICPTTVGFYPCSKANWCCLQAAGNPWC